MRIIAGSRRGRIIEAPRGTDTRPTYDRVRESVFGIIQFSVGGKRVLDLFGGSGALGLEALSRGAGSVLFNDASRQSAAVIRANIEKLGFGDEAEVYCLPFDKAIERAAYSEKRFDLVFLDPPYRAGLIEPAMAKLLSEGVLERDAVMIAEHHTALVPGEVPGARLADRRVYRETTVSFYQPEE